MCFYFLPELHFSVSVGLKPKMQELLISLIIHK